MDGRLREKDLNISGRSREGFRSTVLSLVISALTLLPACGTHYGIYHKVRGGQTIDGIARTYNVSREEIVKINGLTEPVKLRDGDKIFIPGASIEKIFDAHEKEPYTPPPAKAGKKPSTVAGIPPAKNTAKDISRDERGRFIWPVDGKTISNFGTRNGERHQGIDIKSAEGTPVKAADSGKVIYSGDGLNGYGNLVIIKHAGTFFTVYAHNKKNLVNEGEIVEQGDIIAHVGSTGRATTPHLHFEIRKNKVCMDPTLYLP